MILPLRRIHRGTFQAFAVILPVLFLSGLVARHKSLSKGASRHTLPMGNVLTEQVVALDGQKIPIDLYSIPNDPAIVQFAEEAPLAAPDVQVYWSEAHPSSGLPNDARWLGSFSPATRYRIPDGGRSHGYVILYTVARQQVLGSFLFEGRP